MSDQPTPFEQDFTIPSLPAAVFAAWTSADALRAWFAEHVEAELREGGPFKFWGKHTLGAPAAGDADQRVVSLADDGSALAFTWTVLGVASRVDLAFEPAEYTPWSCGAGPDEKPAPVPGCKLTIRHALEAPLAGFERPEQLIDDHWRLAVGNLMGYLDENAGGVVLPDYAADEAVVETSVEIDAPIEEVFRALTEPAQLDKWMAKQARVELEIGGAFDFGWSSSPDATKVCRIVELDPPRRLTISWPDWRGDDSVPDQRVHWTLEPLGDRRTKVELRHDGFVRAADRSDYQHGWPGFLEALQRVAEANAAGS